jgi:hypothetical protein
MWAMSDVGKLSPNRDLQSCNLLNLKYLLNIHWNTRHKLIAGFQARRQIEHSISAAWGIGN